MISALIRFSLIQRLMLLLAAAALTAGGVWAFSALPIDAFPDISPPQVQVIVKAPGLAPTEVESRITFPIEMEMQGIPNQRILRSTTKYALSNIVIDFEDGTDIYWARQQVAVQHRHRLRGRHRHLLGAPAGYRAPDPGARGTARGRRGRALAYFHPPERHLHVPREG